MAVSTEGSRASPQSITRVTSGIVMDVSAMEVARTTFVCCRACPGRRRRRAGGGCCAEDGECEEAGRGGGRWKALRCSSRPDCECSRTTQ